MVKHSYLIDSDNIYYLSTGRRYIFYIDSKLNDFKLYDVEIGETVSLKFTLIGAKNNSQIKLFLNENNYTFGNVN